GRWTQDSPGHSSFVSWLFRCRGHCQEAVGPHAVMELRVRRAALENDREVVHFERHVGPDAQVPRLAICEDSFPRSALTEPPFGADAQRGAARVARPQLSLHVDFALLLFYQPNAGDAIRAHGEATAPKASGDSELDLSGELCEALGLVLAQRRYAPSI